MTCTAGGSGPEVLAGMAEKAEILKALTLVKAFWREGQNEHNSFRFIQAFVAYYYVIEGTYAPGRSSEASVLIAYAASSELCDIVDEALRAFGTDAVGPDPRAQVRAQFAALRCSWSPEGAFKFLFHIRGSLHHFNPRSPRIQGTPLNQDEFEGLALFGAFIATMAIARQEVMLANRAGVPAK